MKTPEEVYNEFWKPLVEQNGQIDMAALKNELFDYWVTLNEAPKVYEHITNGKFTKPNTDSQFVIDAADENCSLKWCHLSYP